MSLTEFQNKVLMKLKEVPCGKVTTYGYLARAAGHPGAARAVGNAVNKNPWAPRVPCHRVVASGGGIGGFASGINNKIKLLKKEGVEVKKGRILGFNEILYKF
jgi:methylated-DNA-[protein]-cysteine S-methyltransferase